jgi:HlyD family secretion protein
MKYLSLILMGFTLLPVPQSESRLNVETLNAFQIEGTIKPRREIVVRSGYFGVVDEIYVSIGDKVEKGQKLALIKSILDYEKLELAQANYARANLELDSARDKVRRLEKLFHKQLISNREFDDARRAYDFALADREQFRKEILYITDGKSHHGNLDNNIVYASASGTIIDVNVGAGDHILAALNYSQGTPIVSIANMNDMVFSGIIGEHHLQHLHPGQSILIKVVAYPDLSLPGTLETVSLIGEERTEATYFSYKASIKITENKLLRSGLRGLVTISLTEPVEVASQ